MNEEEFILNFNFQNDEERTNRNVDINCNTKTQEYTLQNFTVESVFNLKKTSYMKLTVLNDFLKEALSTKSTELDKYREKLNLVEEALNSIITHNPQAINKNPEYNWDKYTKINMIEFKEYQQAVSEKIRQGEQANVPLNTELETIESQIESLKSQLQILYRQSSELNQQMSTNLSTTSIKIPSGMYV